METRHRGRAALPHRRATGDRGGHRGRRAEPNAGAGKPGVRPHRMTRNTGRAQCAHTVDPCNKVPENAYPDWRELKKRVITPAVNEINQHSEEGGFFVSYEGVREGKSFAKIRFMLTKTADRDDRDMKLQGKARRGKAFKAVSSPAAGGTPYEPTHAVLDQPLTLAPGWHRQGLVSSYHQWSKAKEAPDNLQGAFLCSVQ